jgi:hypothetical protein
MNYRYFLIVLLAVATSCEETLTSQSIISKSIAYHDPEGQWKTFDHSLNFEEQRPDGTMRETSVHIDLPNSSYYVYREDQYEFEMVNSELKIMDGEIDSNRAEVIKNYYLYLWGLPMKLADHNTPIGDWKRGKWQNKSSLEVEVNYEKDTWFFHFDPETFQMIGYQFYTDSLLTKGENIYLQEVINVQGIQIPKRRSWYSIPDNKYLGVDILASFE